ncbi:hypothetical protein GBAR_LOCUS5360 [Geodia barretti]|uniref:Uncharacterized protein n=1 Tax=Geodia barretti TaxID=519541 RepID=A0AA35RCP8_GEOBA|nr:hypothetical protein GBAR_LOCUS5360 [Geodia barretti]
MLVHHRWQGLWMSGRRLLGNKLFLSSAALAARRRVSVPCLSAGSIHLWSSSYNHHRSRTTAPVRTTCRLKVVRWWCRPSQARFYCSITESEVRRRVEDISALFFEARELLGDARASANTVYFNEDMQDARIAVEEAVGQYNNLLSMLSETQSRSVVATIGLKMEELKAQLAAITEEMEDS